MHVFPEAEGFPETNDRRLFAGDLKCRGACRAAVVFQRFKTEVAPAMASIGAKHPKILNQAFPAFMIELIACGPYSDSFP